MNCEEYCGTQIRAGACTCYEIKICLCCCQPCYTLWSLPIVRGVKNPEQFLSAWKFAVDTYSAERGVPRGEMATFTAVNDNIFDTGAVRGIHSPAMATKLGIAPVVQAPMIRQ